MRLIKILAAFFALARVISFGGDTVESNVSVFEGEEYAYVIYPPAGYQLITDEAADAGYSMAYIPRGHSYDNAKVVIDINIFKMTDNTADDAFVTGLVADDIMQLKKQYGKGLTVRPVDSVYNANNMLLPTFYFNDTTKFIPTVMLGYFNGKTEIIIFQLSINKVQPRFEAEEVFLECVNSFKSLIKGDINERNKQRSERN